MQTVALLAIVALAQVGQTQDNPVPMKITMPEVEVRSGPTLQYYVTSKLRANDIVLVVGKSKDAPDWYMISPPPGSYSWVNAKYVHQVEGTNKGFVKEDGAKLMPGSSVDRRPPNVETMPLDKGAILDTFGQPIKSGDGNTWLTIQPWHKEVRYIPADAVAARQQFASGNAPGTVPAQFASRSQPQQSAWAPTNAPPSPWPPTQTASFTQNNSAAKTINYPPTWSQVGVLRRSTSSPNGQAAYAIEDTKGHVLLYVNCQPGFSLQGYVNRTVSVYGAINYRSDDALRTFVMQATHVALY